MGCPNEHHRWAHGGKKDTQRNKQKYPLLRKSGTPTTNDPVTGDMTTEANARAGGPNTRSSRNATPTL